MARPKIDPEHRRSAYLRGRVTAKGKAEFLRVAKALGKTEGEAVREAASLWMSKYGRTR